MAELTDVTPRFHIFLPGLNGDYNLCAWVDPDSDSKEPCGIDRCSHPMPGGGITDPADTSGDNERLQARWVAAVGEALGQIIDREEGVGAPGDPPAHYEGNGMQPFDVIDAFDLNFYEGNALKYLLRWRKKGGLTDLQKARHYLDEQILRVEQESQ